MTSPHDPASPADDPITAVKKVAKSVAKKATEVAAEVTKAPAKKAAKTPAKKAAAAKAPAKQAAAKAPTKQAAAKAPAKRAGATGQPAAGGEPAVVSAGQPAVVSAAADTPQAEQGLIATTAEATALATPRPSRGPSPADEQGATLESRDEFRPPPSQEDLDRLAAGAHSGPHSILGAHPAGPGKLAIRT